MRPNPALLNVPTSPITEAYGWTEGRSVTGAGGSGAGSHFLDVSQAVPGYPPAAALREYLAHLVTRDDVHGYTDQLGVAALREELALSTQRHYAGAENREGTHEGSVEAANVGITAGCNQAFCLGIQALATAGDEVILAVPYYFNHDMWLQSMQVTRRYLECDERQLPRLDQLGDLLTARTRALVLITPNNPTGAVYPPALLERAFELCREAGIALILDETYRDFRAEGASGEAAPAHTLFSRPDWSQTLVQLFSFSKVFALAGHRVGSIIAAEGLLEQVAKVMDCVAICPPRVGQEAALFGLRHLAEWVDENRTRMASRLELFRAEMRSLGADWQVASSGAYFAYLRHPFGEKSSREVARLLAQQFGLLTLAGEMFGPQQEAYLRVAFANLASRRIPELADRLAKSTAAVSASE